MSDSDVSTGVGYVLLRPVEPAGPAVQDEVDPTLGADSLEKSLIAGSIGLFLVLLFMVAVVSQGVYTTL